MKKVSLVQHNIDTIGQRLKRRVYGLALRLLVLVTVVVVVSFPRHARGQVDSGGFLGQIADQTGATISQAKVRLVSEEIHQERQAICSDDGDYIFPAMHPDKYMLAAEAPGFGQQSRVHLIVKVQQQVQANFMLQRGAMRQTVNVAGSQFTLQTQNASVEQVESSHLRKLASIPQQEAEK